MVAASGTPLCLFNPSGAENPDKTNVASVSRVVNFMFRECEFEEKEWIEFFKRWRQEKVVSFVEAGTRENDN